jgi:hypothetical protein
LLLRSLLLVKKYSPVSNKKGLLKKGSRFEIERLTLKNTDHKIKGKTTIAQRPTDNALRQHKNAPQRYYGQPPHKAAKRLRHKNTAQPHKALLFIPFPFGLRPGR